TAIALPTGPRVMVQGVDVSGVGHDIGDPAAPIVIVELSDFGCQYCASHALETLPALEREFVATGKVYYKHVPFVLGMFPNADRAARAAECAGEQDRFWQMHDSVFVHQKEWKRGSDADGLLSSLARDVVPDGEKWAACYAAGRQDGRTTASNSVAARLRVRATPTFFINGQMVEGALPLDVLRQGLNAMLADPRP
ncbi:MAG: DsbA family protein, partial [Gemmatimonadaceae bacterium]